MPITHDPDFAPEIAQLVDAFSRCAHGHKMMDVVEAAANMLSCSLHNYARAAGMTEEEVIALACQACNGVLHSVQDNLTRQSDPTDVAVKAQ